MLCDIDHFKNFNDTHGHQAGDVLLQKLGTFFLDHLRGSDIACPFGGEEFALILPEARLEAAQLRADLLRQEINNIWISFQDQTLGPISMSFGIASFPDHGTTRESLLGAADTALYRAKKEGRNRVIASGESV